MIPDLIILGGKSRSVRRSNPLTINAKATTSSHGMLEYYWDVRKSNDTSGEYIPSTSKDPSKFIVPANVLDGNSMYTVELSVVDTLTHLSSTDTVYVNVLQGNIVAKIQGGIKQTVSMSKGTVLDASILHTGNFLITVRGQGIFENCR